MTRPPFFQRPARRQALPAVRVAADLDSCVRRIACLPRPPHPPAQKAPPCPGKPQEGRGAGHSFSQCRDTGTSPRTRGCTPVFQRNPHGSKRRAGFQPVDSPRVDLNSPWVGPISPYPALAEPWAFSSLLLLFLEERERKERSGGRRGASTGWDRSNKVCPQVGGMPHGFFVAEYLGKSLVWRGFTLVSGADPRSTGGNACVPPAGAVSGGVHGE